MAASSTNAFKKHPFLGYMVYVPAGFLIGLLVNAHKHDWDRVFAEWDDFIKFSTVSTVATWLVFHIFFLLIKTPYDMHLEVQRRYPELPQIEKLNGNLSLKFEKYDSGSRLTWEFYSELFVTTVNPITVPKHKVFANFTVGKTDDPWRQVCSLPATGVFGDGEMHASQTRLNGPGQVSIRCKGCGHLPPMTPSPEDAPDFSDTITVVLRVGIPETAREAKLEFPVTRYGNSTNWRLDSPAAKSGRDAASTALGD